MEDIGLFVSSWPGWLPMVMWGVLLVLSMECWSILRMIANEVISLREAQDNIASELRDLQRGPRHGADYDF